MPGDYIYVKKLLDKGEIIEYKNFTKHIPVIVVPKGNPKNIKCFEDLTKPGVRLAIGDENIAIGVAMKKILANAEKYHPRISEKIMKNVVVKGATVMCHGRYLLPHLSVEENIGYGIKDKRKKERVKEVAEILGIEHLLKRKPETLSMGEQQRVALARALAVEPKVILLDEPLNSLDRLTHENLLLELKRIHESTGTTFIHVTHDFIEAISLANRIAVLKDGKIEQCGDVEEILRKPKNVFVAKFVGVKNLLMGKIVEENGYYVFEGGIRIILNGSAVTSCSESVPRIY